MHRDLVGLIDVTSSRYDRLSGLRARASSVQTDGTIDTRSAHGFRRSYEPPRSAGSRAQVRARSRNLLHMCKTQMPGSTQPCRVCGTVSPQGNISARIRSLADLLANVVSASLVRLSKIEFSRAEVTGEGDSYSRARVRRNSVSGMRTSLHDVTVVGSGAGGGIAACRHGLNLLPLEVGRTYNVSDRSRRTAEWSTDTR